MLVHLPLSIAPAGGYGSRRSPGRRWILVHRDDGYQTVTPSAFHSRSACASRGETSGYSGSAPTSGRIFHDRAHLVPTAFSTTTATPGTSLSRNASAGASSLDTIAFEVMNASARSI